MSEFFRSTSISIDTLLKDSGAGFEIPVLQRKYVWTKDDIEKLIGDIKESFDSQEEHYFIGGMVFAEGKDGEKLIVIDGQQRLITIHLILSAARDIFSERGDENSKQYYSEKIAMKILDEHAKPTVIQRLKLYSTDNEVLERLLGENKKKDEELSVSTSSQRNLLNAKSVVRDQLEEIVDLGKFMKYVLENVFVVQTVAGNQSTAFRIFETLNNRGKTLRPDDLLKNLICQKLSDEDFDRFGSQWDTFINKLSDGDKVIADVSTFLKHYIMSLGHYVSKEGIYEWFRKNQNPQSSAEAFQILQKLDTAANQYRNFIKLLGGDHLPALRTLGFRQGYIILLATAGFSSKNSAKVSELVEDIAFCYAITGKKTNSLEREFCDISAKARSGGNNSELEVIESLRKLIAEMKSEVELAILRIAYPKRTGKRKVKYFLYRLASALDGINYQKHEIEHVMPGNTKLNPDEYEKLVMSIGNLTLLSREDNGSAQDKSLKEKFSIYQSQGCRLTAQIVKKIETGSKNTAYDKALKAMNYSTVNPPYHWNGNEIKRRAEALVRLSSYLLFNDD